MNKKIKGILVSILTLGIAATLLGTGTLSFYSDPEASIMNTFAGGEYDLYIGYTSEHMGTSGDDGSIIELASFNYDEQDTIGSEKIFNFADVKPGDYGETTIYLHAVDNDGWIWFQFCNLIQGPGNTPEPEPTPDYGELADYITFDLTLYKPGGTTDIWQKTGVTLQDLMEESVAFGPYYMEECETYELVIDWAIPPTVGNIIQGDIVFFDLIFYGEQWRNNDDPYLNGLNLCDGSTMQDCILTAIKLDVLDGLAGQTNTGASDDFEVRVDGTLVYTHTGTETTDGGENWIMHTVDISSFQIPADGTHTIEIKCIENKWANFDDWGQLAVDSVELFSQCHGSEYVDIATDTTHNLQGWSPNAVGPGTTVGGNYGGKDCRVTWWGDSDTSEATLDITFP